MTTLKIRMTYQEGDYSVAAVSRTLGAMNQFYYFSWLVENGSEEQWNTWPEGLLGWIEAHDLMLRSLHYGSACETEVEVKDDDESALREAVRRMQEAIDYLKSRQGKSVENIRDGLSEDLGTEILTDLKQPRAKPLMTFSILSLGILEKVEFV